MLQATSQSLQTFPPVEGNSHPRWCRAPARTAPAWILFLVALAGPFPMFGAAILDDHSEQANVLEEGKKRIEERRFPEAIAAFGRLKQMAPLDPRAYFLSGIALAESGHLSAAAAELYESVRLGPEQPEPALALGNVLIRLGQKRQATRVLGVFEQKTALNRLSTANLSELVKVYFSLEMTSQAFRAVDELAAREPDHPRIDFYRGKIYKLIGNLDLAQHAIEKSLKKAPGNPADHFELGKIYEQRGQMEAAKKAFLEALKHRENDPDTLYAMASVCLSLNDMDEAIKYLTRAEPAAAHLPKIYYALGQAYQRNFPPVTSPCHSEFFQVVRHFFRLEPIRGFLRAVQPNLLLRQLLRCRQACSKVLAIRRVLHGQAVFLQCFFELA